MPTLKTLGLSPKAVLAFLFPFLSTVAATVAVWVNTGTFNAAEVRTAVAGLITTAIASIGAYVGEPGDVAPAADPSKVPPDEGDAGKP